MKESYIEKEKTVVREFNSLGDFKQYITNTPINKVFEWGTLSSVSNGKSFTGTNSYEDAMNMFEKGWDKKAQEITKKLDVIKDKVVDTQVNKIMFDVVGFQCSVPRYLQGIPTSMVNKKRVVQKQKVITLNKDISYNGGTPASKIEEVSIQTLQLVKKIESQGVRVNLNIVFGSSDKNHHEFVKIRIKSAGERLNVSKLAFPLVHPSMLRRLFFRYIEVAPTVTSGYKNGYGTPFKGEKLISCSNGEYVLPRMFNGDITSLGGSLKEILNHTKTIKK